MVRFMANPAREPSPLYRNSMPFSLFIGSLPSRSNFPISLRIRFPWR